MENLLLALLTFSASLDEIRTLIPEQQEPAVSVVLHPRKDFFKDIMGVEENEFTSWYNTKPDKIKKLLTSRFIDNRNLDELKIQHNKRYIAGKFEEKSIQTLRDELKTMSFTKALGGKFSVVAASNPFANDDIRRQVDIGALQANPDNKLALFQIASNFNALEMVSPNQTPEDGISNYIYDNTQGPFGAISAAPGLIYRQYFIYNESYPSDVKEWRQTENNQINFLSETFLNETVKNGYPILTQGILPKRIPTKYINEFISNIHVGIHSYTQVTFGMTFGNMHEVINDDQQKIHQVYTAALDVASTNASLKNDKRTQAIAQAILNAAYEGTILAAATLKTNKVFLTLIGGGVFGNNPEWIYNAIEATMPLIKTYGLDVTLIVFDSNKVGPTVMKKYKELTENIGGTFTELN